MKQDLLTLTERATAVEKSVLWWNSKMNETIDRYESAREDNDGEALDGVEKELKALLRRAEMEKIEMAKIESEINQACAEAAFKGGFESGRKRRKNG